MEQGSILLGTRVFEETEDSTPEALDVVVRFIDAIVLTQSCDIRKPARARLLVAEVNPYREVATLACGLRKQNRACNANGVAGEGVGGGGVLVWG